MSLQEYLPSNKSAIFIDDFEDVEDLAEFIKLLDKNSKLYNEYLNFKDEPLTNQKLKSLLLERDWEPDFCRRKPKSLFERLKVTQPNAIRRHSNLFHGYECFLCHAVHRIEKSRYRGNTVGDNIAEPDQYRCPSPRRFDENGRYSVHDDRWSAEWSMGRYEALAMKELISGQITTSEREFQKLARTLQEDDKTGHGEY